MRNLYLSRLSPSARKRLLRASGALLLLGAGTGAVACEHAEAVQAVREQGKEGLSETGRPERGPQFEGVPAKEVMVVGEEVVADNGFVDTPLVVEEGRDSCGATKIRDEYVPDDAVLDQVQSLINQMDVNQKVTQLTGVPVDYSDRQRWTDIQRSRDVPELNLKGYLWRDGPHGLNLEAGLNENLMSRNTLKNYSTSFPTSVSQGATFDFDLVERVGEAMGDETQAAGQMVLLGPCMNVLRHPFWGRSQETFGEDTWHLGRIGTAISLGIQKHVAGCAKHYIANNVELKRFFVDSTMDEQTLREVYARHFEMVSRDGGIACMMAAYNHVNGVKATQSKHLLTDVLRTDFGFQGFVLTDWWAMPGAYIGQGPVDPPQDQGYARQALEAGLNVEVPWLVNFDAIPSIVADGTLDVQILNDRVEDVLEQKIRFNSHRMDQPIGLEAPDTTYDATAGSIRGTVEAGHTDLAREAAEKGMVLLKNDGALPLQDVTKVAVVGATVEFFVQTDEPQKRPFNFAREAALGDRGSSRVSPDPSLTSGPFDGIAAVGSGKGVEVVVAEGAQGEVPDLTPAQDADAVIVVVGLTPGDEGEEYTGAGDRESYGLPAVHNQTVTAAAALGKPTIVVIETGGVVDMPWLSQVDAVVQAWYPGQRGGEAMGRLFFGDANFGGRLPVTWPQNIDQFGQFSSPDNIVPHDYYVGYRKFDKEGLTPLFAFGHGLSYSTFRYERIHIPCSSAPEEGLFHVEVDVRNIDGPAGDEVIQVYASYPETTSRRSVKELRGFARVNIQPGELKRVSIPVRVQDLKFWDVNAYEGKGGWVVENGPVVLSVGPSSAELPLQQSITIR